MTDKELLDRLHYMQEEYGHMNVIDYIIKEIEKGNYKEARQITKVEMDKIRHTPFEAILNDYFKNSIDK